MAAFDPDMPQSERAALVGNELDSALASLEADTSFQSSRVAVYLDAVLKYWPIIAPHILDPTKEDNMDTDNPTGYSFDKMKAVLEKHGYFGATKVPSVIQESPVDYTEIEIEDGLIYWISPDEIDNNTNLLVGIAHRTDSDPDPIMVMSMELAVGALTTLVQLHAQDMKQPIVPTELNSGVPKGVPAPTRDGMLPESDGFDHS